MEDLEKLQAIIKRAVERGWIPYWLREGSETNKGKYAMKIPDKTSFKFDVERMIFSHGFAKSFWGTRSARHRLAFQWQLNIQRLALLPEAERLDYLYSFVKQSPDQNSPPIS